VRFIPIAVQPGGAKRETVKVEYPFDPHDPGAELIVDPLRRKSNGNQTLRILVDIFQRQVALTLGCSPLADREQA
jgi:hypothetical protein